LEALNLLSAAEWKLAHLDEFYAYDEELKDRLSPVIDNLSCSPRYRQFVKELQNFVGRLFIGLDRDGSEREKWIGFLLGEASNIRVTFDPAYQQPLTKAIQGLNETVEFLGGSPRDSQGPQLPKGDLARYLVPAFANFSAHSEFFDAVGQAVGVEWPAARSRLESALDSLGRFVAADQIDVDVIQGELAIGTAAFLAVAQKLGYSRFQNFIETAARFQEAAPESDEFADLSFALSDHFHRVLDQAARRRITPASISQVLLAALSAVDNSRLGDAVHYTQVFAKLVRPEYATIFTSIHAPLRTCYRNAAQRATIDVSPALRYLQGRMPTLSAATEAVVPEVGGWKSQLEVSNVRKDRALKALTGEEAWARKAFIRNNFEFKFAKIELEKFKPTSVTSANEYQLRVRDKSLTGRIFERTIISNYLRDLADYEDAPPIETHVLRTVFLSRFKPNRLGYASICPFLDLSERPCPGALKGLQAARIGDIVERIDFSETPPDQLMGSFLPAVARLLEIVSPVNIPALVDFLSSFQKTDVKNLLYSWVFLYFNPLNISEFFDRYFSSVTSFVDGSVREDDRVNLYQLLQASDYLVTFGYFTLLVAKSGEKLAEKADFLVEYCSAFSALIAALSGYCYSRSVNKEFVSFLDLIASKVGVETFLRGYEFYLSALKTAKPVVVSGNPQLADEPGYHLRLALASVSQFASNPLFLNSLLANQTDIPRLLTELYSDAFGSNNFKLIRKFTIVYSELAGIVETPGADVAALSGLLFPLLTISTVYRRHQVLAQDPIAADHFAVIVILLLHLVGGEQWKVLFRRTFKDEQQGLLIDLLKTVLRNVLLRKNLPPDPYSGIPPSVLSRSAELKHLNDIGVYSKKQLNYGFLNELTVRSLAFIWELCGIGAFRPQLFQSVVGLFVALLNRYQDRNNYALILVVLAKFIDVNYRSLFLEPNPAIRGLVLTAFQLLTRQLQQAKGAGVALIVHLLFRDYSFTRTVLVTSDGINEQLIDMLWTAPAYKHECLVGLVESLTLFLREWADVEFVKRAFDVVNNMGALCTLLEDNSPRAVYPGAFKAFELFKTAPLQLMHWIDAGASLALAQGDLPVAFDLQRKLAVVIWATLIKSKKDARAARLDLSFLAEEWASGIDLNVDAKLIRMLQKSENVSITGLVAVLQGAIEVGERGGFVQDADILRRVLAAAALSSTS
jgi:hypothetical protein